MATKARRHIHKYYKAHLLVGDLWACALPNCGHYMPQHIEGLLNGKNSICWNCSEIFTLNPMNMKSEKPICNECAGLTQDDDSSEVPLTDVMKKFLEKTK